MKSKSLIQILFFILFLIPVTAFSEAWVPMTSGTSNALYGVWGSSTTDVFAVGSTGTILHYDGNAWSPMTSGTTNTLNGVWGSSGTDVFAVGTSGTILHYDGITWSPMAIGTTIDLLGIWGSSGTDVYVVKYCYPCFSVLHYDGIAWSSLSAPAHAPEGIWGSSPTDVYIVGWFTTPYEGGQTFCILHYDGTQWFYYIPVGLYGCLFGIWGSSNADVFAVGSEGAIFHYNGSAWSAMTSGTPYSLNGIWGNSGTDMFAVGDYGTIIHYDGSIWSAMTSGTPYSLTAVWGSSGMDVFAVGSTGEILHYSEPTLISLSSFTATGLNRKVILEWVTESEIDNSGFNLYRADAEEGEYVKLNESLIPAQGSPTQGASYQFVDNDVKNRRTYYYKLEDVDLNGTNTMHGPVSAVPRKLGRDSGLGIRG